MAKLSIFVSFEFDKDNDLRGSFYAQAKEKIPHWVFNRSLKEAYPSDAWKKKARKAIEACDVVIVLIGPDTHNAQGVIVETDMARSLCKPVIQIRPQDRPYKGLTRLSEPIDWNWETINAKLDAIVPRKG